MARIAPELVISHGIRDLILTWPALQHRLESSIGKRARLLLKERLLSGQEINLVAHPRDKKGRYTITSSGVRGGGVVIRSYPVNLFERGRLLRSGRKEPGKYIITRKLKSLVDAKLQGWVSGFDRRVLAGALKDV